ncbi:MAG TPA: hypothetical protein VGZ48_04430 [Candidatus Acidoferrales bacterium]|nr:hypothetical protein [Candidatus Acidoferrales bacterium]
MSFKIDPARKVVFTTVSDELTEEDVRKYQEQLLRDPKFDPEYSQLIDATNLKSVRLSSLSTDRLLRTRPFKQSARCAVIAESDLAFGISRMIEVHCEAQGIPFRGFRKRANAEEWLFRNSADTDAG